RHGKVGRLTDQAPVGAPWQRLYFFPEPHGQGALREGPEPTACPGAGRRLAAWAPGELAAALAPALPPADRAPVAWPAADLSPEPLPMPSAGADSRTMTPPPVPAAPSIAGAE